MVDPKRNIAIGQPIATNMVLSSLLFLGTLVMMQLTRRSGGLCLGDLDTTLTRIGVIVPYHYRLLISFVAVHMDPSQFMD